jgi:SAM-dependent methyltransferase
MKIRAVFVYLLNYFPKVKSKLRGFRNRFLAFLDASSQYVPLKKLEASIESLRLRNSWQSEVLPQRQRQIVDHQLQKYKNGEPVDVFDIFLESLRTLPDLQFGASLLEIGCSSGYYSELIDLANLQLIYEGCDYSDAFIRMARNKYPSINFNVQDATSLTYPDSSFDVVVSGCCLLHIPDYSKAVEETVRVTRNYAIFHRTPVVWGRPEQWYRKKAYGIETIEIHFNEIEFIDLLNRSGLKLISTYTLSEESTFDAEYSGHAIRTYVCRKNP